MVQSSASGIVQVRGPVLSPATRFALQSLPVPAPTAGMVAGRALGTLLQFRLRRFIPYFGQAATALEVMDAIRDAEEDPAQFWDGVDPRPYDAAAMAVFRGAFIEVQQRFLGLPIGLEARRNNWRYILIAADVMPNIARVDAAGIAELENALTWDPANARRRRRERTRGMGSANLAVRPGMPRPLSWEEYPFAATYIPANPASAIVDAVPLYENWVQGGFIRAAAMIQDFEPGNTVYVFIVGDIA